MPLHVNASLGPYTILEKLGEGGMGEVYKARDTRLNRIVAVKSLPAGKVADANRRQRFLQEAQAASALNHPNIITIHDWIEDSGNYVLVMEYVAGKTLEQVIPKKGLRLAETLKYAVQIADALAAAHAAGIIHRDVKPANIMVTEQGRVKVLDFGLAKLEEPDVPAEDGATRTNRVLSEEGTIAGSVPYMSPEQAEGKKIDARSDIFSFGAVLYEMVTGQRAFQGETRASTMAAVLKSDPKPASQLTDALPKELDRIIARCLRKDLDRRSHSMAEIKLALDEIREESESGLQPAAAATPRKKSYLGVMAIVAIAVAVVAGVSVTRNGKPPAPTYTLRQITRDSSDSNSPAVSPDGKLIVYGSNRGGQRDLWIQQLAGGEAVRLTNSLELERDPHFFPDGSQIVFARGGGGLQVISTLGGSERQLTREGSLPQVSRDGKWIVYKVGAFVAKDPIYIIPSAGGAPRELKTGLVGAGVPIWSPSGSRLLITDFKLGSGLATTGHELYLVRASGDQPVRVEGVDKLAGQSSLPSAWLSTGTLIFSALRGQVPHIWKAGLSEEGKIDSQAVQLTNGTGEVPGQPSEDGRIIPFTNATRTQTIYEIEMDGGGTSNPEPVPVVAPDRMARFPTFSADGGKMVYAAYRADNLDIWIRDMKDGKESVLVGTPADEPRGLISPDGSKVAFQRIEKARNMAYWMNLPSGEENKICEDCRSLLHWTPDGKGVLISEGNPEHMVIFELATGRRIPTAVHPDLPIHDLAVSNDGKWFAFVTVKEGIDRSVYVSRFVDGRPTQPTEWMRIYGGPGGARPFWSASGDVLYYFRAHGQQCLFARRLDSVTKQPIGKEIEALHFHGRLRPPNAALIGYGLVGKRLFIPLLEGRTSVWIAEASDRN